MSEQLTYDRLHEVLHYGPATGTFTWKETFNSRAIAGKIAGCKGTHGYVQVVIDGKPYRAHRLAWLYIHGYLPENQIDHINRVRDDNRIANLREVSQSCNSRNSCEFVTNTSGVKGVAWHKCGKWESQMYINNKKKFLGYYEDFDDAVCARLAAEQCVGWSGCDSTSSAYLYVQKMLEEKCEHGTYNNW